MFDAVCIKSNRKKPASKAGFLRQSSAVYMLRPDVVSYNFGPGCYKPLHRQKIQHTFSRFTALGYGGDH